MALDACNHVLGLYKSTVDTGIDTDNDKCHCSNPAAFSLENFEDSLKNCLVEQKLKV